MAERETKSCGAVSKREGGRMREMESSIGEERDMSIIILVV